MISRLWINEDNDVILDELKLSDAGTYVNDATVTCRVTDTDGTEVVAAVTMTYEAASDGKYRGVIDADDVASLTDGFTYYIECTIVSGEFDGFRRVAIKAGYHGAE